MRRFTFIITILGIFILILLLLFQTPISISSQSQLNKLQANQKILITGRVIKQTTSNIYLNNNFTIQCEDCPDYKNQDISTIVILNKYNNKNYLKALRIKPN